MRGQSMAILKRGREKDIKKRSQDRDPKTESESRIPAHVRESTRWIFNGTLQGGKWEGMNVLGDDHSTTGACLGLSRNLMKRNRSLSLFQSSTQKYVCTNDLEVWKHKESSNETECVMARNPKFVCPCLLHAHLFTSRPQVVVCPQTNHRIEVRIEWWVYVWSSLPSLKTTRWKWWERYTKNNGKFQPAVLSSGYMRTNQWVDTKKEN